MKLDRLCVTAASLIVSAIAALASAPASTTPADAPSLSTAVPSESISNYPAEKLIRVPLTRQARNYTCGVSALQSVLAYYGDEFREDQLEKACKSDKTSGTRYWRMADFAKSKGYQVAIATDSSLTDLQALLDKKLPVIVLIQAWPERIVDFTNDWDDGHYVVAIGYDANNVYFMDPSTIGNYTFIPKDEFLKRWHDCETKAKKLHHFTMVISKNKPAYDPGTIKKLG